MHCTESWRKKFKIDKIEDVVTGNCYGCRYHMPSKMDHVCLEEDAGDAFKHLVQLENVLEKVATVVRALNLKPEQYQSEEDLTLPVMETVPEDYEDLFEKTL